MQVGTRLVATIFLIAFIIYLIWGIEILRINPKKGVNRGFFLLAMGLSLWALGFALGNTANTVSQALFWRKLASVGRLLTPYFALQFIILLSYQEKGVNKPALALLSIPAIVLIYVFSFSGSLAAKQYNLQQIKWGWIDKPFLSNWNKVYYLYFIVYILSSIWLMIRWLKTIDDQDIIKKVKFLQKTIAVTFFATIFFDILPNLLFKTLIPQLSLIFLMYPILALYRAVKADDILAAQTLSEEFIVNEEEKRKIYRNLAIAYYISAFLAFVSEYFPHIDKENAFILAFFKFITLLGIGIAMRLAQNIKDPKLRENVTNLILILSIPMALFQFSRYAAETSWAFPLVIMISTIIFSRYTLLLLTAIMSIVTQILMWIIYPKVTVTITNYDYIKRISIIIVAYIIGLYVNRLYISIIKKNKQQTEFQKLAADVSYEFVSISQANYNHKFYVLLKALGEFFDVDRTYLFTIDNKNQTMTYAHEWVLGEVNEEVGTIDEMPLDVFPWWLDQLNNQGLVYIADVENMPKEAPNEQAQLRRQHVKSLVSVPVIANGVMLGFIGMDSVLSKKVWTNKYIEMLNIMANILSTAMTQLKSEKAIEYMAYYDSLTNLPNRSLFEDRVCQAIEKSKRSNKFLAVIFIDLDNFKIVNDIVGHSGGDDLLRQVGSDLSGMVRATDTVARFGGDEFVILLDEISDYEVIVRKSNKLMKLFSELFVVSGQEFMVTASAGIAIYPIDGRDCDTLVKNADIAMYEAKETGKNQYVLCSQEIKDETILSMELAIDLYHALERKELEVYYQPQINLATNEIIGNEALLRWNHPERGIISPRIFIPIAEKNRLINSIGEWVFTEALLQNKKWQNMGLPQIKMAVNMSAAEMLNPKMVCIIDKIIKENKINPKDVVIEITESFAIREAKYAISVLDQLKEIGVSISIDDFGTEYSSLSRLKMLPIDQIKIDMEFIQGLETSDKDRAISKIIIDLGKNLGLSVVAEGVETKAQKDFLCNNHCDYVQGYFYYKPMPASEVEKILVKASREYKSIEMIQEKYKVKNRS